MVPLKDHFAGLVMFEFAFAGVLIGLPPTEVFQGHVVMASLHPDPGRRARLTGQVNFVRRGGFHAPTFGRMLAKVAHAFTVAELGMDAFDPVLPDIIRQIGPQYLSRYIGGSFGPEPKSTNRHELGMETYDNVDGVDYLVVWVRLFANRDMPAHYVVTGRPKARKINKQA